MVLDGLPLKAVELTNEVLSAADCVLILTDHLEFDYRRIVEFTPLVARNTMWGIPAPDGRIVTL